MDAESGVSMRQVKLKVLYTFDSEHKNNHLARWPHTLDVQSAQLDESTNIGCVDLRTCLEAVIAASPELAANYDNDHTVYAYDYSEPDTPLVGQGMLSKALGQEGSVEAESEAMVTGKITKSVMGLFSKNAQETLEVKLRFTPVAGTGYRRRSGSVSSAPDTIQQWNSTSQSNASFRPSSPMDTSGIQAMQRMLSEGGPPRDRTGSLQGDSFYNQTSSRPVSRSGTPVLTQQYHPPPTRQPNQQSRPSSRAGNRPTGHARRDSFNSGYYSGEDFVEEGPARKRAKVQKVEQPKKSNLNIERQPDSLRVAASIASSVRIHRPAPIHPAAAALQNSNFSEEPVRPPTPVPVQTKTGRPRGRPRKVVSANLLRGPKARASSPIGHAQQNQPEASFSSPEDTRAESVTSTPADLPSSPPVMPETQPFVTSPQLPPLSNETDSGFMSGNLDDLFGEGGQLLDFNDFINDKPDGSIIFDQELQQNEMDQLLPHNDKDAMATMADLPSVFDEFNETERAVTEMEPPPPKPASASVQTQSHSFTSSQRPIVPAPRLAPALAPKSVQSFEDRRAQSAFPQVPASDPIGRTFQRSHTWAPDMSDAIMSDAITNDEQAKFRPKKRVGKEQTKARLENAIASGEMPPFCDNCGSIETPAWRRAYTKVFDCPWDDLETSLEPGECCYKEPLERDADGNITKFKGYKSERRQEEKSSDGWTQICLCNPCGLWFHKSKFPRPPEKWQKRDPNEKRKRKRGPKARKKTGMPKSATKSDAVTPASDESSPPDTAAEGADIEDVVDGMTTHGDDGSEENEPELPPMPREVRGGSAEPTNRGLRFHGPHHAKALTRQIQSSPVRAGRTQVDAIEIDLTPKPVRRQLFPSPDSLKNKFEASAKRVVASGRKDLLPSFVRRSPRLNKIRDIFATQLESTALVAVGSVDKENVAPAVVADDGLDDLFDGDIGDIMPPPTTPKRRSERLLFRTPGRTPSRNFGGGMSPNVQRTPSATRTPNASHPIASIFLDSTQRGLDPIEMTPFTRSIHEVLSNPGEALQYSDTPKADANGRLRKTPKKSVNKEANDKFDFPDLPSLKDSSPMSGEPILAFNFSELTTDRLQPDSNDAFSTDLPMPSSPPEGYFSFVHGKEDMTNSFWGELGMQEDTNAVFANLDDDTLHVGTNTGSLRRSPRRHAA